MPEVTAAVPVKDRREQMLRCLDALLAQDHPDYEILVIDNGSTDGTPEAIRERAKGSAVPVRVEVVPGPVGAIRNRAAELCDSEFIAFTDSDCLPQPGWLTAATNALKADPRLGVVQGKTLPEETVTRGWPATIEVTEFSNRYEACNLVFRRAPFAESDGFDEEVGHFWEDTPAGLAIKRLGWEAAFVPDAVVFHDVTYPGYWWHVKRMQKNQNLAPVLAKYPEMRREVLFWRIFLQERDARFIAFLAGVALARRTPLALVLAVPYAVFLLRQQDGATDARGWVQAVLYDFARVAGLLRGGLRNGRIVL